MSLPTRWRHPWRLLGVAAVCAVVWLVVLVVIL